MVDILVVQIIHGNEHIRIGSSAFESRRFYGEKVGVTVINAWFKGTVRICAVVEVSLQILPWFY